MTFLDRFGEPAYALLRIFAGLLFLAHGVQKLFAFPAAFPMPLTPMLTAAAVIELVAGTLIVIGLFTRPAAFIGSGFGAAAYFVGHVAPSGIFFLPILNGGETAILLCFIMFYIIFAGPGSWSLDGSRGQAA